VRVQGFHLAEGTRPAFYPSHSVCKVAHALARWNVHDCSTLELKGWNSWCDSKLDHSHSLAYAQALLPLQAAEWPKQVRLLRVWRPLVLDDGVRQVLQTIFPAVTVSDQAY
jgi:hypothetical protein